MKRHWFILSLIAAAGSIACREERAPASAPSSQAQTSSVPATAAKHPPLAIQTYGELHAMMHDQKTGPAVNLAAVLAPTLYGLGALSELRGEVTILSGTAWLAYPGEANDTRVETTTSSNENAALLVTANVPTWTSLPVPNDIDSAALDQQIESLANAAGVDTEQAFPILIEGDLINLHWHVIDGRRAVPSPSSHEQHMQMAAKGEAPTEHATLLGFFSKHHQGVFTHHGENTHFHFVDQEKRLTGHVDAVGIKAGALFKVPS